MDMSAAYVRYYAGVLRAHPIRRYAPHMDAKTELRLPALDPATVLARTSSLYPTEAMRAVTLSLSDINGPRGGADLRCTVTLELRPRGSARGEATSSDLMAAVGRALARARSSLRRASGRGRRTRSKAAGDGRSARAWDARA